MADATEGLSSKLTDILSTPPLGGGVHDSIFNGVGVSPYTSKCPQINPMNYIIESYHAYSLANSPSSKDHKLNVTLN